MKHIKIHEIKQIILFGIFFIFTNFLTIHLFKKVELENIHLSGAEFISVTDITENSSLKLPKRLVFIKTKLIEKELEQNISLKQISITRQLFPFGLGINLLTREPIAFAEREDDGIKIKGFVDNEGVFIERKYLSEKENLTFSIKIFGWKQEYQNLISLIIKTYKDTEDLQVIKISTEGFVTLEEKVLKKIFLGFQTEDINEKLKLIFNIKETIKKQKFPKKIKSVDLSDLNNPNIKVFIP